MLIYFNFIFRLRGTGSGYAFALWLMAILSAAPCLRAESALQSATLQGIITDELTRQTLEGANITIHDLHNPDVFYGAGTDRNGFYQIRGIESGVYILRVSHIGYITYRDTVSFDRDDRLTRNAMLEPDDEFLDELVITSHKPAARREVGRVRVTAADLGRVPTPAGSGDLASYLQKLPGVVAIGDRGGQLFIRGGTPYENMVLVDGLMIYQPFHIVGFFSAFPEELMAGADFYPGGFRPRYSGRTSSVIDVRMKDGNRQHSRISASLSPFLGEMTAEGPIKDGDASWIVSTRTSLIEQFGHAFSGEKQPLHFDSQYARLSYFGEGDARCSALIMRTYDRGQPDYELEHSVRWRNFLLGGRCQILPARAGYMVELNAGFTQFSNDAVNRDESEYYSEIRRMQIELNVMQFAGSKQLDYGFFINLKELNYDMSGLFQIEDSGYDLMAGMGIHLETSLPAGRNVKLQPGAVLSAWPGTYRPALEPRLRSTWLPFGREDESLSAVIGLYRQPLTAISDKRDAGSVFAAWRPGIGDSQMRALHALLGWRQSLSLSAGELHWSLEGYYKRMHNIPVPVWSTLVAYTTDLALAKGQVYGGDIYLEFNRGIFYGFTGYGYTWTQYESVQDHFSIWFGEPVQRYHPPHDRRHQLNTLVSMRLGRYKAAVRWQLGTGLPFTRPMGFDEILHFRNELPDVRETFGDSRIILERPYDGRLPATHRLDISLERHIRISSGRLVVQAGAINLYNQVNLFYYDLYTHRQINQLPFFPYVSLKAVTR